MGLLSGIDNATGWALLQKNSAAIEKAYASTGSDAADIAYFQQIAPSITTPDELLNNYRALTFVATAYGLGTQVDQIAILKKLMTEDPNASTSLAQQLSDNNYRTFANALSVWTPPPFSSKSTIDATIAGFKQHSFNDAIGQDSVPLQEASYFTQNAQGMTKLSQLMADKPLLDVVRVALGIPEAFGNLTYNQQVAILTPRVDMTQFATAAGVSSFVNKYLGMDQLSQATSAGAASNGLLALFSNNDRNGNQGLVLTAQQIPSGRTVNLFA